MSWFTRRRSRRSRNARQATAELLDTYHDRASILDGDDLVVDPGKVLANFELAMERIDNDIDTPVAINDFASAEELMSIVHTMSMGPMLLERTLNTAFRIMLNRYPEELVRAPLPPDFDVRKLAPLDLTGDQNELGRSLFNLRARMDADIGSDDVEAEISGCSDFDVVNSFMAVFVIYGLKVGALKSRTGIG